MRVPAIAFLLCCTVRFAAAADSCVTCHAAMDSAPNSPAALIKDDIHIAQGLSCANCHGGDPSSDDMDVAMNRAKGFKGKPARKDIPKFCGSCHSNPDYMRQHAPRERVDQVALYETSVHGKRLAAGDDNVATCIDCHSVHNIRAVKDSMAPVYPTNVPATCARCHADSRKMAKYGIPTNQYDEYKTSVHYADLTTNHDVAAPTCASCHGNHGAKPPDVESVAAVCGTCHALFAQLYEKSVHEPIFSGAGGGGGCVVCHSNHGIHQPSTAMLAGPNAVCSKCHDPGTPAAGTAAQLAGWLDGLDSSLKNSAAVLTRAEESGMEVSEAQLRLNEGHEDLVKARLAVHSMEPAQVRAPVDAGMKVAGETLQAGQAALKERDLRRYGLGASVVFIALAILAIRALLRRMEDPAGIGRG